MSFSCNIRNYNDEKEGNLRLVDGTEYYNGRVEIFHNNQWGIIY